MLHMCKSHDHGSTFVEGEAFLVKNDLFDPCDPYMTFDAMLVMWHVAVLKGVVVTKYGQNRFRHVGVISWKLWQKKKERNGTNTRPFLVKNDLFDPSDPYMTFDPLLVMWHNSPKVRVIVTKFGRNQSRNVEVISRRSVARRKKHEENNTLPPKAAR